jgi:hypothetical protein
MPKNFKSDGRGYAPPINRQQEQQQNNPFGPIGGYPNPVGGYGGYQPYPLTGYGTYQDQANPGIGYNTDQYLVKEGDTLADLASRYNISIEELLKLNNWNMEDASKGIVSAGGAKFQIQPGWYVRVPIPQPEQDIPYRGPVIPDTGDRIYHTQKGDTFREIASFYNLTLEQLLYYNELRLDRRRGEVLARHGHPFQLSPGVQLLIPSPNKNISLPEADKVVKDAANEAANQDNNHMEAFFVQLLKGSENILGEKEESNLHYSLGVEIPIAGALALILGGKFKQRRKSGGVVEHKLNLSIGMEVEVDKLVSTSVDFSVSLHAASDNVEEAARLFSYGFYKFGRQAADNLNDWDTAFKSAGTSTSLSAGLYYGLNFMYSDKSGFKEKFQDTEGAEQKMTRQEKRLFDYKGEYAETPFDKENKNKVAFGGSIKGSAKAGSDTIGAEAGVSAEIALQNTISSDTLNKTGIYGRQDEDGFLEDYEVGSKSTLTVKYGGEVDVLGTGVAYSSAISFDKYSDDNNDQNKGDFQRMENSGWQFKQIVTKASVSITDLSSSNDIADKIYSNADSLSGKVANKYNSEKENSRKFDPKTEVKPVELSALEENLRNKLTKENLAVQGSEGISGKVTDAVKAELKIVTTELNNPQITLTIAREREKSVNLGLVNGEMVNLEVYKTFDLSQ